MRSRHAFVRGTVAALLVGPLAAIASAQPPGPPPGPPGPPPGGPAAGIGMLLRTPEVRDELGLTEDQMMELRDMGREFRGRMADRMDRRREGRRGGPPEGRRPGGKGRDGERRRPPRGPGGEGPGMREEMRGRMQEMRQEVEGRLSEILDEDQMSRLRELVVQQQLQAGGPMALMHGELGDSLDLTDEQRDTMHDRARELRSDAAEQLREIRRGHTEELLNVLTSEQRARLDAMQGEPFDLPEPEFRGRRGPGFEGRPPRPGRGEGRGEGRRGSGRRPGPPPADEE